MGLTTWSDAPSGKIKKTDVAVAKNYLSEFEKYRIIQDKLFMSDYDKYILQLEEKLKE